jgi:hypothetical protein
MSRVRNHLPAPAMVIALLALFVALGGTTYAALRLPKNSVGTKQLRNNAVTMTKISNGAVTGSKIANNTITGADINLSTLGTVPSASSANSATTANSANTANSATSAKSATSANHASTADNANHAITADELSGRPGSDYQSKILWARIALDGTLTTGSGATSSGLLTTGQYEVTFSRAVTGCAYEATPGSSLVTNSDVVDDLQRGTFIRTEPRTGHADGVFVEIYDSNTGNPPVDNAFHLAVIC